MNEQIENNFKYHKPKEGQQKKYVCIRDNAKALAMTKLEECGLMLLLREIK